MSAASWPRPASRTTSRPPTAPSPRSICRRTNARFAVRAELEGSAFVPVAPAQWREVLCRQESRQVGNDNCVRWRGRSLQIPPSRLRPHFVRAEVRLHVHIDGAVALFWGPHRIADFPLPATEADSTNRAA